MTRRILYGGLFHETHTFLPEETRWSDFTVTRSGDIFGKEDDESPTAGFLACARELGWEVVPTIDARAMPSGIVSDEVLETYWREFEALALPELRAGVDAIFLVLHGAMATPRFEDVEGELLTRIRSLPGAEGLPLFGVLDLHGNLTDQMCERANGLVAYRKNPHIDAKETAIRATRLLERCLTTGQVPRMTCYHVPVVWAPPGTGTHTAPMKDLIDHALEVEVKRPDIWAFNVMSGFSFADTGDTGVTLSVVALANARAMAEPLESAGRLAWALRAAGVVRYSNVDEIISLVGPDPRGVCLLVEPADNIGAGAPGDGTGVLRAMLVHQVARGLVAINDPAAVVRLQGLAAGGRMRLGIGGKGWRLDPGPVDLEVTLVSRSNGEFQLEDPRSHLASISGSRFSMGPSAVVRHQGVHILLTSKKTPPFDLAQFRSQGLEPSQFSLIGVKAAVAHKQAYDPIATASYWVSTFGPCSSDLSIFPYAHLRRPIYPLDRVDHPQFRLS